MYNVVLFDLDGTITESGEGITKSVQYALEKLGKPEPDLEKLKVFVGPPLKEMFMKYSGVDEETAKQAVVYYRERYADVGIFENRPYEGIEAVLAELREKGYLLAIASSKPEVFVKKVLDHFELTSYFDEIVGSEIGGARTGKAEVIEETLRRLGYEKKRKEVLMVGDKEHDVLGARACGISCVAVSYGYGTLEELTKVKPLQIVDSPEALLNYFRLSPLRKQKKLMPLWNVNYPWLIYFGISQVIATIVALVMFAATGDKDAYLPYVILLTGISALLVMPFMIRLYKRDRIQRFTAGFIPEPQGAKLKAFEGVLLLFMGAALSMFGNILMAFFSTIVNYSEYEELMETLTDGKSLIFLIFAIGIAAPIAEEMIFRWCVFLRLRDRMKLLWAALISGAIFGIYHGNLVQFIYATILGTVFAYLLERTGNKWSCVWLHIGANIWSLIFAELSVFFAEDVNDETRLIIFSVILFAAVMIQAIALVAGLIYFDIKGNNRGVRRE